MPIEPPPCRWAFPPADGGRRGGAARARRRPRARHAAGRLPRRHLPDAARRRARDRLVQPRPARRRPARRVPPRALAAPLRAPLHGDRRPGVRRRRRRLRRPAPARRLDHARDPRRLRARCTRSAGRTRSRCGTTDGALAGGLYGVEIGGLFAAESKFHVRTDASKVALAALVERLRAAGGARLLDVQWTTPHLRTLGARDVARADYLRAACRRRSRRRRRSARRG